MKKQPALWTKDFILIIIVNVLVFCGCQVLLPTLPLYIQSIGGNDETIGVVTALYMAASLLIRPFTGLGLDSVGRRGVFLAGMALLILPMLCYSFLPAVFLVCLTRSINGAGWGMFSTASTTIAADVTPLKRMDDGMSFFTMTSNIGLAVSPAIGLAILSASGFTAVTMTGAGILAAATLLSFFIRCRSMKKPAEKRRFSPYEKRSLRPSLVMAFAAIGFGPVLTFISLYGGAHGIGGISLFFTVSVAALFLTRMVAGRLISRFGFHATVLPGFMLFAVSLALLFAAHSLPFVLLAGCLEGVGYGSIQISMQTMALLEAPEERTGAANATFLTSLDIGVGLGNLLGGIAAEAFGYDLMYLLSIIPLVVGAALYLLVARNRAKLPAGHAQLTEDAPLS